MNYALQRKPAARNAVGIGIAVVVHLAIGYALVTGLAKKVIDVIKQPIDTRVIEEIRKPPPPVEAPVVPPPRLEAPPPPFIPPPEVQIATPAPMPAAISNATATPPAMTELKPVAPAGTPAKPAVVAIGVACPKMVAPVMPAKALQDEIDGAVTARVTVRGGKVVGIDILKSQPRGLFDAAVRAAIQQYQCQSTDGQDVQAVQDFVFKNGG